MRWVLHVEASCPGNGLLFRDCCVVIVLMAQFVFVCHEFFPARALSLPPPHLTFSLITVGIFMGSIAIFTSMLGFFPKRDWAFFLFFFLGLIRFRWRFYETTYLHRLRPAKDLLFST